MNSRKNLQYMSKHRQGFHVHVHEIIFSDVIFYHIFFHIFVT